MPPIRATECPDGQRVVVFDDVPATCIEWSTCVEGTDFPIGGEAPADCRVVMTVRGSTVGEVEPVDVETQVEVRTETRTEPLSESSGSGLSLGLLAPLFGVVVLASVGALVARQVRSEDVGSRKLKSAGQVPRKQRDPNRTFSAADARFLAERAGHRCEWVDPDVLARSGEVKRCEWTGPLQADHFVVPHSHGGPTCVGREQCQSTDHGPLIGRSHVDNGAALCQFHNSNKSNRVMSSEWIDAVMAGRRPSMTKRFGQVIEARLASN